MEERRRGGDEKQEQERMHKGRRGRRPSTAPVDDAGDNKDAKQMPFWEDLYSVTDVVAPWCLFSKLMVTPEVPLKLPVPTSFMFIPDEKLVARISTGLDGKLCVRNDSKETPVTFEMMETNLIESFTSRVTDRQPYICTIYSATDFRPRFVSKANFTLFTLYLRASLGQNISSYGREEQEQAAQLFPPKIACVQAYIPIEMDKRFISVFLKSPIRTLVEVHQVPYYPEAKIKFFVHEPPVGEERKLSLLTKDDPKCSYMTRTTAGIISCLRNYHDAQIPGFVCEFVQGIDGNVYFTSVLRIAKPVVDMFPSEVVEVSRILAQGGAGRATVQKIAAKMAIRAAKEGSQRKNAGGRGLTPRVRGGTTPRVAGGGASSGGVDGVGGGGVKMTPRGREMTATSKLTPRVGTMSSLVSMTTPKGAVVSSKSGPKSMDDSPGSGERHGQGEDKEQVSSNQEEGQGPLVSTARGGRAGDAVRMGTPSAMSPSAGTHSPAVSPQSKEHTLESEHRAGRVSQAIAKEPLTGRAQRAALLEMAERLHQQGSFAEAIDILAKAEVRRRQKNCATATSPHDFVCVVFLAL